MATSLDPDISLGFRQICPRQKLYVTSCRQRCVYHASDRVSNGKAGASRGNDTSFCDTRICRSSSHLMMSRAHLASCDPILVCVAYMMRTHTHHRIAGREALTYYTEDSCRVHILVLLWMLERIFCHHVPPYQLAFRSYNFHIEHYPSIHELVTMVR
jgi:hypothetical protein